MTDTIEAVVDSTTMNRIDRAAACSPEGWPARATAAALSLLGLVTGPRTDRPRGRGHGNVICSLHPGLMQGAPA